MTPTPTKPLAGLRVLELARILAGPWAGQLLADLGADVIKVERPGRGDDTRHWGPPFLPGTVPADGASSYFESTNRGKRSVALDLANVDDLARVKGLAAEADVLIENFKVGALARHGLDHAALRAANPGLIYCSITGFGQTGPYAGRAGYDFLVQGMGGAMALTGEPEGEPMKSAVAYADVFTGLYASNAILAALHARAPARGPAVISTWRCSTRRSPSLAIRRSTTLSRAKLHRGSATRIRRSCPIRCSPSPTVTSLSLAATTSSSGASARSSDKSGATTCALRRIRAASPIGAIWCR